MALVVCHLPHQNIPAFLEPPRKHPHALAHTNLKFRSFYSNTAAGMLSYYATFVPGCDFSDSSVIKQPAQSPHPAAG